MNRKLRIYSTTFLTLLMLAMPSECLHAARTQPQWRQIEVRDAANGSVPGSDDAERVDVVVKDGFVFITVGKDVQVKVFTILGQLVAQRAIPAGTTRLHLAAKGIYILKIGPHTRRINI